MHMEGDNDTTKKSNTLLKAVLTDWVLGRIDLIIGDSE